LQTSNCSLLLIYLPRKDERLYVVQWLVTVVYYFDIVAFINRKFSIAAHDYTSWIC